MSKDVLCPECGIEGEMISGQGTQWRFCQEHGIYWIYRKCRGCDWEEQNKRRRPCHKCTDQSEYTQTLKEIEE